MAWSISTYAGTRAIGSPSNYRTAMFELIRALDERQEAIGFSSLDGVIVPFSWSVTSGTGIAPTMANLLNLRCTGPAITNSAQINMKSITDRLKAMLTANRFLTTSGGSTFYTVASMETAIGASLDYPVAVNEARWWQAVQDALDRMIYAYTPLVPIAYQGTADGTRSESYSTINDAWTNRAEEILPGASTTVSFGIDSGWSIYRAFIADGSNIRFKATDDVNTSTSGSIPGLTILGSLVSAEYTYTSTFTNTSITEFEAEVYTDTITVTGSGSGTSTATPVLSIPMVSEINILTAQPSSNPFSFSSPDNGIVSITLTGMNVKHNIASVLTDQA